MRTLLLITIAATAFAQQALPPDIDPQSLSRLPFKKRAEFTGDALKAYDAIVGKDAQGNPRETPGTGPAATSLYSIGVALPMNELNQYVRNITPGTAMYQLCSIIAAREFDEPYEWNSHEGGARRAGVSEAAIEAVKFDRPANNPAIPEKEALVIQFGRALFRDHKVSSQLYQAVVKGFGQQGMLELVAAMGDYAFAALMLRAVDQHVPNVTAELPAIKR